MADRAPSVAVRPRRLRRLDAAIDAPPMALRWLLNVTPSTDAPRLDSHLTGDADGKSNNSWHLRAAPSYAPAPVLALQPENDEAKGGTE
jgi:hypothetical protein